jgi:hypothetical protein
MYNGLYGIYSNDKDEALDDVYGRSCGLFFRLNIVSIVL